MEEEEEGKTAKGIRGIMKTGQDKAIRLLEMSSMAGNRAHAQLCIGHGGSTQRALAPSDRDGRRTVQGGCATGAGRRRLPPCLSSAQHALREHTVHPLPGGVVRYGREWTAPQHGTVGYLDGKGGWGMPAAAKESAERGDWRGGLRGSVRWHFAWERPLRPAPRAGALALDG